MKIICVARNYGAHIKEMGSREMGALGVVSDDGGVAEWPNGGGGVANRRSCKVENDARDGRNTPPQATQANATANRPELDAQVFFMKPDTALLRNNEPFFVPDWTARVDYECELVVRVNRVGRSIAPRFAHRYYAEVGLGIDFTARDVQAAAQAAGLPWEAAKAFDRSAAVSAEFVPLAELGGEVQNLRFEMRLNGEVRQSGWTGEMIHPVDEIIAHVSRFVTLKMGDLIFTGTPAGVGPVAIGDRLTATLEGRKLLDFAIK